HFLAIHLHLWTSRGQYCGFKNRTFLLTAAKKARSSAHGFLDPLVGARHIGLTNHRADVSCRIHGIARTELADTLEEQVSKFSINRVLDQNPLHRDTGL